jgi:hypothetical protein
VGYDGLGPDILQAGRLEAAGKIAPDEILMDRFLKVSLNASTPPAS